MPLSIYAPSEYQQKQLDFYLKIIFEAAANNIYILITGGYGLLEPGEKALTAKQKEKFFTSEPNGLLNGHAVWTPTLFGFKMLIDYNRKVLKPENYKHHEWTDEILKVIESK